MDVMTEYEGVVPDDAVAHTNVETFAGNPEVPLFKKEDNGWKGKHEPSRDHKATFQLRQENCDEKKQSAWLS